MPTYEYECPAGHRYEKREGFDAPATQKCIKCRKTARRVLFAPPIVFKGSGFYVTDSRGSGAVGSSSSESSSDDKSDSSSESSSETKADAKPETKAAASDHGHTHGPGGHTHDAPAPAKKPEPKADKAAASS
jgi:putative FmdB family regulatory protein